MSRFVTSHYEFFSFNDKTFCINQQRFSAVTLQKLKMECMKLNFPQVPKCYSYIFYTPRTQLPSLKFISVVHTCFTLQKLKMECMKFNFPQVQKCHACVFYTSKTQNGMDETQLPSSSKMEWMKLNFPQVQIIHVLHFEDSKWHG